VTQQREIRNWSSPSSVPDLAVSNLTSELESSSGHSNLGPSHSKHRLEPNSGFRIGIPQNLRSQFPIGIQQSEVHIFDDQVVRNHIGDSTWPQCKRFDLQLRNCQGTHGVVVSHLVRMRKALSSNPDVSMIILQSKYCQMLFRLSVCVHCDWLARIAKWGCHRGSVYDGIIFADGFAVPNAPDLFGPRKLSGTGPR
jgi:hypothetical protein